MEKGEAFSSTGLIGNIVQCVINLMR